MKRNIVMVIVLGILITASVPGCSNNSRGTVAGRVTLDGAPVTGATILFEDPAAGIGVQAPLDADGKFEVKTYQGAGLPPGTYKVAIAPGGIRDPSVEMPLAGSEVKSKSAAEIPVKYHKTGSSGLTATVQAGGNPPFQFELKKP